MIYNISLLATILFLLSGCSKDNPDIRLTHISEIVSESPEEALCSLDSIDYISLSIADKYFYNYLTIKAQHKAYIRHSSDSLFIPVHDYYSNNRTVALSPEVLYYGGKAEAEASNKTLWKWITGFTFAFIILVIVILFLKNRDKKHIIKLQQAIEYINSLEQDLNISQTQNTHINNNHTATEVLYADSEDSINPLPILGTIKNTEHELREKLKYKLMSLYESTNEKPTVPYIILQSEPYQTLLDMIRAGKSIKEDDKLWSDLEQVILKCSPKFKTNLYLLTLGRLTILDLHTSLLIKCGIKPSQMTILLGRSNGAIISRRESLCLKVLDKKLGVKVIDGLIRLL